MGFFSDDSSDPEYSDEIRELVENAESDTVTAELLTSTDTSGILSLGIKLEDNPLNHFIKDDEQPHFVFYQNHVPVLRAPEADLDLTLGFGTTPNLAICITDRRIILIESSSGKDIEESINYNSISEIKAIENTGHRKLSLHLKSGSTELIEDLFLNSAKMFLLKGQLGS